MHGMKYKKNRLATGIRAEKKRRGKWRRDEVEGKLDRRTDRQTDRRTPHARNSRAMHSIARQ